jgi:3-hydroxyacyl-CoA dehydrogenase
MSEVVRWNRDGDVAVVTVDNPPVNAISHAVRKGLYDAFSAADADPAVGAIVLACAGRTFMAGADITEFGKPWADPGLREVVMHIEASSKPVIAAIHGTALGGGFEIALGCHYRCAIPSAQIGFPEVNWVGPARTAAATAAGRHPRCARHDRVRRPVNARQAHALGAIDDHRRRAAGAVTTRADSPPGQGPRRIRDCRSRVSRSMRVSLILQLIGRRRRAATPERCTQRRGSRDAAFRCSARARAVEASRVE